MGKFKVTETESFVPSYKYSEDFDTIEEARQRMKEMYHETAVEGNPNAIESAELYANSARVVLNDGNEIEYEIEEI